MSRLVRIAPSASRFRRHSTPPPRVRPPARRPRRPSRLRPPRWHRAAGHRRSRSGTPPAAAPPPTSPAPVSISVATPDTATRATRRFVDDGRGGPDGAARRDLGVDRATRVHLRGPAAVRPARRRGVVGRLAETPHPSWLGSWAEPPPPRRCRPRPTRRPRRSRHRPLTCARATDDRLRASTAAS